MKTAKDLELSLLLKEKTIQDLKLKNLELIDKIERINKYIVNNYQYIKANAYLDKILEIIGDDNGKN